jgi:hypothetical protein
MALIDKASLLMVPSTYEAGTLYNVLPSGNRAPDNKGGAGYDQTRADFDFDRGSNTAATRVNADGLIEKYRENLLVQSNQFDTTWTNTNSTETSGFEGYDGTNNAWRIDLTNPGGRIQQSVSASGVQTYSIYAKAGTLNWMRFLITASSGNQSRFFDLRDGSKGFSTYGGEIESKAESVGNGWFRISLTFDETTTGVRVYPAQADNDSAASSGSIYIQNAQLESGLVSTDYLDSTSVTGKAGVLVDLPRINYDANGENGSLLLEPSRANLVQYSEYFGGWGQINTINTANALTSPEGLQNANKLIAASGVNNNVINQQISAGTYTASVFAKKGEFEGLFIGSGPTGAFFNLNTYAYRTHYQSAPTSYKIEDYGNGWHRYSITFTISGNDSLYIGPNDNVSNTLGVTGNNSNGIYIYGAQIEEGSYPTSLIPNNGESGGITRAADSCSVTGASDVIGQTEGTIYFEGSIPTADQNANICQFNNDTNSSVVLEKRSTGAIRARIWNAGSSIVSIQSSSYGDENLKIAVAYKSGETALYINGTQIGTSTTTFTFAQSLSEFQLGVGILFFAYPRTSNAKQTALFKERLSNAELATLTTL